MIEFSVDKNAMKKAEGALKQIAESIRAKAFRQGAYKLTQQVARDAKQRVPSDTGLLKKSIKAKAGRLNKGTFKAWAGIDANVEGVDRQGKRRRPANYAHLVHDGFQHAGGVHVPGRPFMRQALALQTNNGLDYMIEETQKAAERYARK